MFSLPMCIGHADSIKSPLKGPAAAAASQVWWLHTSGRPADVWSWRAAAAVPAGADGRTIHTSAQPHPNLWSRGGFKGTGAPAHSVAEGRTRRVMSALHGNMRVGDLNCFQMYQDGALQMNSMANSGWALNYSKPYKWTQSRCQTTKHLNKLLCFQMLRTI